jgi:hypothetical protein
MKTEKDDLNVGARPRFRLPGVLLFLALEFLFGILRGRRGIKRYANREIARNVEYQQHSLTVLANPLRQSRFVLTQDVAGGAKLVSKPADGFAG